MSIHFVHKKLQRWGQLNRFRRLRASPYCPACWKNKNNFLSLWYLLLRQGRGRKMVTFKGCEEVLLHAAAEGHGPWRLFKSRLLARHGLYCERDQSTVCGTAKGRWLKLYIFPSFLLFGVLSNTLHSGKKWPKTFSCLIIHQICVLKFQQLSITNIYFHALDLGKN